MICLRSDALYVRIDPRHGAEILDLVDLKSGRQLLGRTPFHTEPPRAGDLDEATWLRGYRGGWQMLAPNAGNACTVESVEHGFHGRASNDPWQVLNTSAQHSALRWSGHDLTIDRTVALTKNGLAISVACSAHEQRAPLIVAEHIAFGWELFEPGGVVGLEGGRAYELSEATGPVKVPDGAPEWPSVLYLDGTEKSDSSQLSFEEQESRFIVVEGLPTGVAEIRNATDGLGLRFEWDVERLPHMWRWHESRASGDQWRNQTEIVVIEPSLVPHSLGLAIAIENDQALWLEPEPEASFSYDISLAVLPATCD